jgi:hypothetical protein
MSNFGIMRASIAEVAVDQLQKRIKNFLTGGCLRLALCIVGATHIIAKEINLGIKQHKV